jgi:hypothetical protein
MASTGTIFAVIAIVIVILIAAAVGLVYFFPGQHTTSSSTSSQPSTISTTTTNSTSSTRNTTTTTTTSVTPVTSTITSTVIGTATSTVTSTISSGEANTSTSYALQALRLGSGPELSSPLTTPAPVTHFYEDGLGGDCAPCYTYNYTDNGNHWIVQGDIAPGSAYVSANSSGFTMLDQTCSGSGGNLSQKCGPYWEWNGDRRFVNGVLTGEENVSEISAALYSIPADANVFTIQLHLPQYNFSGCVYNVSSTGCSYEGGGPTIAGVWALDSSNSSVAVSLAEGTSGLSVGVSTAAFVNGQYDAALSKNLPVAKPSLPYTPNHTLTIATDRHSYIRIWVDSILEYSNSTLPTPLGGNGIAVNFYQFDSVDNMTLGTTWSNFYAYRSSNITVTGLQSGMSVYVNGTNGFNETVPANSSGTAVVDVSQHPYNLTVSIELNGKIIDTYGSTVGSGAVLKLIATTSTTTYTKSFTTTFTTEYQTTNTTTYETTVTPGSSS